jgi:hypothetical protein
MSARVTAPFAPRGRRGVINFITHEHWVAAQDVADDSGPYPARLAKRKGGTGMRYALHNVEDSTEVKFPTLDALWRHVRANGLCSQESGAEDASTRPILNPKFEIHDFDACGVVRTEPRS